MLNNTYFRQFGRKNVELDVLDLSKVNLHEYDGIKMWFGNNTLKWVELSLFGKLGYKFIKIDKPK